MKIGLFYKLGDTFTGQIDTLTIHRDILITKDNHDENKWVVSSSGGIYNFGHGWKISKNTMLNDPVMELTLDDPSFNKPITAYLFKNEEDFYDLIWDRN